MPGGTNSDFRLEDWLVQPAQCRLSKDGQTRQVRPKVMDLLTYFATHRGEVVSKDQLLDGVWGSEAVSESALTRTVTELRHALGDDADAPRMLGTIPKRGYRWIGSVTVVASDVVATIASRPSRRTKAKNWLAVGGSAAVLIGAFVAWMWARAPVRIAVLPFDRTIDDPDRQDMADGLAEDIIMSLHTADPTRLLVLGGASTLRYKGTTKSFTAIGHELGVDYLVKAIVWTDGPRLRLTANLIRVRDQRTVWVQSYERDATGILGLQLEVSSAIAEHILGRIS